MLKFFINIISFLKVRVQCFHYLRSKRQKTRVDSFIDSKDDILEPDRQVQVFTKRLSEMDEAFRTTLHPRKTKVSNNQINRNVG